MKKIIEVQVLSKRINLINDSQIVKSLSGLVIGENGYTDNKKEGDRKTPLGIYNVGFLFGTKDLNLDYPYYKIDANTYWVDDINSKFYNNWVSLNSNKDYPYSYMQNAKDICWESAEHLINYPKEYELAFVIEYNTNPCIKEKGSAIFMHIKNKEYTAGCIATTKENMEEIAKWLNQDINKQVKIRIIPQ